MILRATDEDIIVHVTMTCHRLLSPHSSDLTVIDVMGGIIGQFWPPSDGWQPVVADTASDTTKFLFTHPKLGIGFTMMSSASGVVHLDPNEDPDKAPDRHLEDSSQVVPGTQQGWRSLSVADRYRNLYEAYHAHGATRVDLLEAIGTENPSTTDLEAVWWLIHSPVFMDDATRMLVDGFGTCQDLIQLARNWQEAKPNLGVRVTGGNPAP